jgi:predicted CoA-binding protein
MDSASSERKRTVVIVGASDNPDRTSHMLLQRLKYNGRYHPIPVNPRLKKIEDIPVLPSLAEVAPFPDVITMYVNAALSEAMGADLERLRPAKVIFNPGAENPDLRERLSRKGIDTEEACSLVLLSQNAL